MLIVLILLALCLFAAWGATDTGGHAVRSEAEPAGIAMTLQFHGASLADEPALELRAAHLASPH